MEETELGVKLEGDGFVHKRVHEIKRELIAMGRECWQCGDYQCLTASPNNPDGSPGIYAVGATTRICGSPKNPRWKGSCPATTTLDDGSVWQFSGNCKCDG